jgi:hypothetical protein
MFIVTVCITSQIETTKMPFNREMNKLHYTTQERDIWRDGWQGTLPSLAAKI